MLSVELLPTLVFGLGCVLGTTGQAQMANYGVDPCDRQIQRVNDCKAAFATEVELFGKYNSLQTKPNCTIYSKLECCVAIEFGVSGCRNQRAIERTIEQAVSYHPAYSNCPRGLCDAANVNTSMRVLRDIDESLHGREAVAGNNNVNKYHENMKPLDIVNKKPDTARNVQVPNAAGSVMFDGGQKHLIGKAVEYKPMPRNINEPHVYDQQYANQKELPIVGHRPYMPQRKLLWLAESSTVETAGTTNYIDEHLKKRKRYRKKHAHRTTKGDNATSESTITKLSQEISDFKETKLDDDSLKLDSDPSNATAVGHNNVDSKLIKQETDDVDDLALNVTNGDNAVTTPATSIAKEKDATISKPAKKITLKEITRSKSKAKTKTQSDDNVTVVAAKSSTLEENEDIDTETKVAGNVTKAPSPPSDDDSADDDDELVNRSNKKHDKSLKDDVKNNRKLTPTNEINDDEATLRIAKNNQKAGNVKNNVGKSKHRESLLPNQFQLVPDNSLEKLQDLKKNVKAIHADKIYNANKLHESEDIKHVFKPPRRDSANNKEAKKFIDADVKKRVVSNATNENYLKIKQEDQMPDEATEISTKPPTSKSNKKHKTKETVDDETEKSTKQPKNTSKRKQKTKGSITTKQTTQESVEDEPTNGGDMNEESSATANAPKIEVRLKKHDTGNDNPFADDEPEKVSGKNKEYEDELAVLRKNLFEKEEIENTDLNVANKESIPRDKGESKIVNKKSADFDFSRQVHEIQGEDKQQQNKERNLLDELIEQYGHGYGGKQQNEHRRNPGAKSNLRNSYYGKRNLETRRKAQSEDDPFDKDDTKSPFEDNPNDDSEYPSQPLGGGTNDNGMFRKPDYQAQPYHRGRQNSKKNIQAFKRQNRGEDSEKVRWKLLDELDSILDPRPEDFHGSSSQRNDDWNAEFRDAKAAAFARQEHSDLEHDNAGKIRPVRKIIKDPLIHKRYWIERQEDDKKDDDAESAPKEKKTPKKTIDESDEKSENNGTETSEKKRIVKKDSSSTGSRNEDDDRAKRAIVARERHFLSASSGLVHSHRNKNKVARIMRSNNAATDDDDSDDDDEDDDDDENDEDEESKSNKKSKKGGSAAKADKDLPKQPAKNANGPPNAVTINGGNAKELVNRNRMGAQPEGASRGRTEENADCVQETLQAHTSYCKNLFTQHQMTIEEAKRILDKRTLACYKLESVKGCLGAGEYFSKCDGKNNVEYRELDKTISTEIKELHCNACSVVISLLLTFGSVLCTLAFRRF